MIRTGDPAATNRATAGSWHAYAGHRARLTDLIALACGAGARRLTILGAGNCNDVDLHRLLASAATIELVDLDGEAVRRGVKRQRLARSPCIEIRGGVDLTAAGHCLAPRGRRGIADAEIDRYATLLARVPPIESGDPRDVVVSACLLTALVSRIAAALGPGHPRLLRLTARVRDQHLRVLTRQLAKGGRGLLVSDFVSSDTCPALLEAPDEALPSLAERALRERNFFTGTNPLVVRDRLRALAPRTVTDVRLEGPWRWHLSATRAYLVYALAFRRR